MDEAKRMIQIITTEFEEGQVLDGVVVSIKEFGAFIEFAPGKEGMVHISKIAPHRIEHVEDVLTLGDKVRVVCLGKDRMGRLSFSIKDAQERRRPRPRQKAQIIQGSQTLQQDPDPWQDLPGTGILNYVKKEAAPRNCLFVALTHIIFSTQVSEEHMASIKDEVARRRTFAIISHPDAGKTTLTEKFLLYGGAINLAGSVKGKATARHAVSDWMEIEKQRGISVTSSVLQFEYDGCCVNLLDTPGHQDFSEDTYRTLMAADSAVMVIDASKGVEAQTRKLFKVCTMRHIPIFTFVNKMDRDALDTFDLLDDIEKNLGIDTCPMNWPIGSGKAFRGVYERSSGEVILYSDTEKGTKEGKQERIALADEEKIMAAIGEEPYETLSGEVELLDGASADFDLDAVRAGMLTPVFFGSALNNFGVEIFLQNFLEMALPPSARNSDAGPIDPVEEGFPPLCSRSRPT